MLQFKRVISTIDAHTEGEPLRIVTSGLPPIVGSTILEKRRYIKDNYDHLRKLLMLEPRGHSGMYGCIITPPTTDDGDFGVLFMHNEGYSTMCGHGIIGVTKVAVETGMIEANDGEKIVKIDSPAGRVTACAHIENQKVKKVSFENVPSFVYAEDVKIDVDGIGNVDASKLGLKVVPGQMQRLVDVGMEIKYKVMDAMEIVHPEERELQGIYGTIITEAVETIEEKLVSKNVTIFADAQIDRSPTGTGTSARVALLYRKGLLKPGMRLINKSIIDTVFEGWFEKTSMIGKINGVVPTVSGTAHIMGLNQLVLEEEDPLPEGFRITGG